MMSRERWSEVERLYHAAASREAADRAAFLADACAGDDALREEVDSLFAQEASAAGFLSHPALGAGVLGTGPSLVGRQLGSYAIQALIGAGGMGEVYRARDTRLDRDVAIKILPDIFANDPERLARFEREAKTLASLNHPNVGQVYGLEESPSTGSAPSVRALVMELVDGDDLSVLIARGPMPLADALPIAKQIAEALEAAHELGIVHRDVKPANVKVRDDGTVKVLDFGLAKALDPTSKSKADAMNSPTLIARATQLGVILGTAAYMSPEQARGKAVDRRADIWAFGVVLYEMLSGRRPFNGEEISDVLAAVLRQDIDWTVLPADTPPRLRRLLERCLDRDPKTRLRDIGEARVAIQLWLANPTTAADTTASPSERGRTSRLGTIPWIIAAVAIVVAAGLAFVHLVLEKPAEMPLRITSFPPPEATTFDFTDNNLMTNLTFAALSPDGQRVVFGARSSDGKSQQLWLRSLDSDAAQPLPGTEGGYFPFWSPNSDYVGFAVRSQLKNELKKISVSVPGGLPTPVAVLPGPLRGASWSKTGVIVFGFGARGGGGLARVPERGGLISPIGIQEPGTVNQLPWFLPDGRHFLYVSDRPESSTDELRVMSIDGPNLPGTPVAKTGSNAMYAEGQLLYMNESTLMAQPFDLELLRTTAEAVSIGSGIPNYASSSFGRIGRFTVSNGGLLLHHAGAENSSSLVWKDRNGTPEPDHLGLPDFSFIGTEFSSDRQYLAVSIGQGTGGGSDVWIVDVKTGDRKPFTFDPGHDRDPIWWPKNHSVIWTSPRKGVANLYRKAADRTGKDELLYGDAMNKRATSVSRDGTKLLFHDTGSGGIWVLPLPADQPGGSLKPRPFRNEKANERLGQFSPDATWVAYESSESKQREIYAAPFSGTGESVQISHGGGTAPRWRRDSKEIFYVALNGDLMAREIIRMDNGTLKIGYLKKLFDGVIRTLGYRYDVYDDKGQRFIVVQESVHPGGAHPLTLVENWTKLLARSPSQRVDFRGFTLLAVALLGLGLGAHRWRTRRGAL